MTTRFSLSELGRMLHVPVEVVRQAVDDLSDQGQLTAESFVFADRTWRVAPSDVKRITQWIEERLESGEVTNKAPKRMIKRKRVEAPSDEGGSNESATGER